MSGVLLRRAYAIRDYYPFWKSRNERSRAGKLLLLDPADDDVIQIFFDDNIGHGSANIVDVRDVRTGEALAFQVSVDDSASCTILWWHPRKFRACSLIMNSPQAPQCVFAHGLRALGQTWH